MELELLKKGLDYSTKKRKWVFALGALVVTGYGAYRVYHLPGMVKKRQRLLKLLGVFVTVIEMISDSAEAIGVISKDLKEFVRSGSNQIPRSFKQISKITRSDEFSESVTKITRALTVGICRGYRRETVKNGMNTSENSRLSDRVLDKLFSDAGSGFASVVVGSFAKNLVTAYYSDEQGYGWGYSTDSSCVGPRSENVPSWIDVLCEERCRALIEICVRSFVSAAVAVYLDKTMHINTYDEFFSGLTNPKYEPQVRDMLVSVCNGAVETIVRTSHHVVTNSSDSSSTGNDQNKALIGRRLMSSTKLKAMKQLDKYYEVGDWLSNNMSSKLAVSSNRRFVLDVTGRVTFETVRSFLKFVVEKISECLRRSVEIIHEEVVEKGAQAFKYLSGRSSVVAAVCVSLCLQVFNGPWIIVQTN